MTANSPARLRLLLQERHWQTYRTFQREYDKAARSVDPALVGTWPSRAQLGRWMAGELKGLPYPDHCRVLEEMFPQWTAEQLFEAFEDDGPGRRPTRKPGNPSNTDGTVDDRRQLVQLLLRLKQVRRLGDQETQQLEGLIGHVIELSGTLEMDIGVEGDAHLSYHFDLLNLTNEPLTRVIRELWFEVTSGPISIEPAPDSERRVTIQRIHDTPSLAKFAYQISPPLLPGECTRVGYSCDGGRFGERHYWRQAMPRHTRRHTLRIRQNGVRLVTCSATEEHPDGSERSVNDSLSWDYEGDGIVMTVTRNHLRPGQSVTLRWEVNRESAR